MITSEDLGKYREAIVLEKLVNNLVTNMENTWYLAKEVEDYIKILKTLSNTLWDISDELDCEWTSE